jgi:hypothetical protein
VLLRLGRAREAVDALKISIWSRDIVLARLTLAEAYAAAREFAAARTEAAGRAERRAGQHRGQRAAEHPAAALSHVVLKRVSMSATKPCRMKDFTRFS